MLRLFDNKDIEGPKLSREEALELYILGKDASLESIEDLNKRLDQVSMEYFKIDWPQFFLGTINTIWRKLTNDTYVTRDDLGELSMIFLSKGAKFLTQVGNGLAIASGIPGLIDGVHDAVRRSDASNESFWKKAKNIYAELIMNVDKVKLENPDYYNSIADWSYQVYVKNIDKLCPPIARRKANTTELKELKLLDFEKLNGETKKALAKLSQGISRLDKSKQNKWKQVIAKTEKFVKDTTTILEKSVENKID